VTTFDDAMQVLDEQQCWALLQHAKVGRLAVDVAGEPDIFPINYVVDERSIVFRTAAGTKLAGAVLMGKVAFEIDGYEPDTNAAWSVVVKGVATQIEQMEERYDAEELPLFPWFASPKPEFVRIAPRQVTGRRFLVVDDTTPDASVGWSQSAHSPPPTHKEFHRGSPYMTPD
jgi:nitroimidazol reductase NimA-like FMN-containing flavoprotein (pyridoxamine 5'-phosphate oxidase superfamily)